MQTAEPSKAVVSDAPEVKTATETTVAEKEAAVEFEVKGYPWNARGFKDWFCWLKGDRLYTGGPGHSPEILVSPMVRL